MEGIFAHLSSKKLAVINRLIKDALRISFLDLAPVGGLKTNSMASGRKTGAEGGNQALLAQFPASKRNTEMMLKNKEMD